MRRLLRRMRALALCCLVAACAGNQIALKEGNQPVAHIYMNWNSPDCLKWIICNELYSKLRSDGADRGFEVATIGSAWTHQGSLTGAGIADPGLDLPKLAKADEKYIVILYPYGDVITSRQGPIAHTIYVSQELDWNVVAKTFEAKTGKLIQTTSYSRRFNGEGDDLNELADEITADLFK